MGYSGEAECNFLKEISKPGLIVFNGITVTWESKSGNNKSEDRKISEFDSLIFSNWWKYKGKIIYFLLHSKYLNIYYAIFNDK